MLRETIVCTTEVNSHFLTVMHHPDGAVDAWYDETLDVELKAITDPGHQQATWSIYMAVLQAWAAQITTISPPLLDIGYTPNEVTPMLSYRPTAIEEEVL